MKFLPKLLGKTGKKSTETNPMQAFKESFDAKNAALQDNRFACRWEECWPCLGEATPATNFDAQYVYHTAWAARILAKTTPARHVDISSCLRFVTLASAFTPIEFYDYRPAEITLSNLVCGQADVTALPFADASIPSLSCMHVVEHIGLERYGDPFDPQGDQKAMRELERVLMPGGQLLFVVPLGEESRIQYNAHRIYSYEQVRRSFPRLTVHSFSLVTDAGDFVENASQADTEGLKYGCGCFHFILN